MSKVSLQLSKGAQPFALTLKFQAWSFSSQRLQVRVV
jgi:hypothetical protein